MSELLERDRCCVRCRTEIAPLVALEDGDHLVITEGKLDLQTELASDGWAYALTARRDVAIRRCSEVHP